jgi:hypothetical protein
MIPGFFLCFRQLAAAVPAPATGMPVPVFPATDDQIDIPNDRYVAELTAAHPRPRPCDNSPSNARVATSLMDKPFLEAYARTR